MLGDGLFEPDVLVVIHGEAQRHYRYVRPWMSLERADLISIAVTAAWLLLAERPDAGGGLIRLRVRSTLRRELWRERRHRGDTTQTFYWPWYRPGPDEPIRRAKEFEKPVERRCADCPTVFPVNGAQVRCRPCQAKRRREQQRGHNQAYYRKVRAVA